MRVEVLADRQNQQYANARSVKHTALVCGYHVLDVDKGIFAAVGLEHLEGLLDKVSEDEALSLRVLDSVSNIDVALLE